MVGIKYILELEGITNVECAERMGVVNSLVSAWGNGKKKIPQSRIIQFHRLFPIYPIEFINKELTDTDKVKLRNLKLANAQDKNVDATFLKISSIINDQAEQKQKVVSDIKELLDISSYSQLLNEQKVNKRILLQLFGAVSHDNKLLLHDYQAINKLEQQRSNFTEEKPSAYLLITIVLSALCEAFDISDSVEDFAFTPAFKAMFSGCEQANNEALSQLEEINECRNNLITIFKNIIDDCNANDEAIENIRRLCGDNT